MEQSLVLLEKLAVKLGTTADMLWKVLVKQAFIDGVLVLSFILVVFLADIILLCNAAKLIKRIEDSRNGDGWKSVAFIGCVVLAALTIFAFILCFMVPTNFLNPEYWALDKILSSLKLSK